MAVLQHKQLPADGKSRSTYDDSGWCTFEQLVASLATSGGGMVYDLSKGRVPLLPGTRRSAEEMEAVFLSEQVYFFGSADRPKVAAMYADLLSRVEPFDALALEAQVKADALVFSAGSSARKQRAVAAIACFTVPFLPVLALLQPSSQSRYVSQLLLGILALAVWFLIFNHFLPSRALRQYLYEVLCCNPLHVRAHRLSCSLGCLMTCAPPLVERCSETLLPPHQSPSGGDGNKHEYRTQPELLVERLAEGDHDGAVHANEQV